jgi:hypothetical protein
MVGRRLAAAGEQAAPTFSEDPGAQRAPAAPGESRREIKGIPPGILWNR